MKKLLLIIATATLIAPLPAGAGGWDMGWSPMLQAQGQKKGGGGQFQRGGRDFQRGQPDRPQRDERRQGRMTDEERRELHKDLDRANREIYRPARPR
jgi:hypothetical protein